jgi:UDP-glucose 4-epimerase
MEILWQLTSLPGSRASSSPAWRGSPWRKARKSGDSTIFHRQAQNVTEVLGQIDLHEADLLDLDALHQACRGVDYVLHEAAIPSVPRSVKDPLGNNRANVDGTLKSAGRMPGREGEAPRLPPNGDTPTLPKREDMPPNPFSPRAVASEYYMTSFYPCYGLETVCLRYSRSFQCLWPAAGSHVAILWCSRQVHQSNVERGSAHHFWGGRQSWDFTDIENVIPANLLACSAEGSQVAGRVINVATGWQTDLYQTLLILKKLIGYAGDVKYGPERAGDAKHSLSPICPGQSNFSDCQGERVCGRRLL